MNDNIEDKNKEIKKLTVDQLKENLQKGKKDLFNFRFRKINGQIESPAKISEIKKQVARLLTQLNIKK